MDMWQERGQALDPSWTNSGMGEEEKTKKGGGGGGDLKRGV